MSQPVKKAPGVVRDAIFDYLHSKEDDASVAEIKEAVQERIGKVADSSVRSYLRLNTPLLFTRTSHGRYTLRKGKI